VLLGPAEPTNRLSAARGSLLVGHGTPKQHSCAPELRGWAKLMDSPSQAVTMGVVVDLAGGPDRAGGAATVATMQGAVGGPGLGAAWPLALRPRPREPRLPCWPTGESR
jgi:hypothetical protein